MATFLCPVCASPVDEASAEADGAKNCPKCGERLRVPNWKPKPIEPPPKPVPATAFKPVATVPVTSSMDLLVDFARVIFGIFIALSIVGMVLSLLGVVVAAMSVHGEHLPEAVLTLVVCGAAFAASVINLCLLDLRDRFCRRKPNRKN